MAKIRHITIATHNLEETAAFYEKVFDLEVVQHIDSPLAKGISLSDGDLNLMLLDFTTDAAADHFGKAYVGLHHLGFLAEDIATIRQRLEALGKEIRKPDVDPTGGEGVFFAFKSSDPNGVILDVNSTQVGWPGARP